MVLQNPAEYKHILALTFTNKATEEMKSRIVESLIQLSKNENEGLKKILADEISHTNIQVNAQLALDNILHDYSNFSVSTIDSFFNRIIRSLAREIQLPLRLEIQLDQDEVITEITAQLLLELSTDKELLKWLTDFAIQKLGDDKGWNIEGEIYSIARELFKENSIDQHSHTREEIKNFFSELRSIKSKFENQLKNFGEEGIRIISENGLSLEDFSRKASGPAGYFWKITKRDVDYTLNSYQLAGLDSSESWSTKSSPLKKQIIALAEEKLVPLLNLASGFVDQQHPVYLGSIEVLKRIYLLGIVEDLKKKLSKYREENNLLLISDTPKILSTVISEEETPFIYEKSGNRFHHFLIDEFQDTSDLQWKNMLPLIINSLGAGNFAMVVGDVKQSIYRWRSGNMKLLDSEIVKHLHNFRSIISEENLATNYRSKKTIVDFNNYFFTAIPPVINQVLELQGEHLLDRAYSEDSKQIVAEKNLHGGKVEIHAIADEESEDGKVKWKESSKEKMLEKIWDALNRGYSFADIAVLVRNNKEGDDVATFLIENGITEVISPDSLLLIRSPEVRFLLNLFLFLDDKQNQIAKSEVLFYYSTHHNEEKINLHQLFSSASSKNSGAKSKSASTLFETDHLDESLFSKTLPQNFTSKIRTLSKLPLYELSEQLVSIFQLQKTDAYVLRFLEMILEYSGKHDSSLRSFLNWWNESKGEEKISVVTSETGNAIRIMTIHKSKGLQFPIVIMPFADWKLMPDARDVMWIESDVTPFSGFGKIPISPNKAMRQSCFADSYQTETVQVAIDNVNLMYVAFTRAEEELYIFTSATEIKEINSVGKLLRTVIGSNAEWTTQLSNENTLILGESKQKQEKKEKKSVETFELKNYTALNWHDKIRLSLKSDELIEMFDNPVKRAINYGVLVHRVLSSIGQVGDVNKVVEKFYSDGIISSEEKEKLFSEISSLLELKEIASFFSSEYKVMNEHEIILPNGETLRPDRVLIRDEKAIVIDFKSGKEHSSHHKQINLYADTLLKMNFTSVEKYLIYIAEKRILHVQ